MSEEKTKGKSISSVLKDIQKKFSKTNPDIIFDPTKKYEVVSSGNFAVDLITGIGGFPKGRITEVIAHESTGKTSLLLAAMGKAQSKKQVSVLFDFEQCFDPYYAERCYNLKLDNETFFLFQPTTIEEGDAIFDMIMNSDAKFDFIAFDSIACMIPQALSEASLEDTAQVGIHARFISRFMHKLKKAAYLQNFAAVCTNQYRHQIQRDRFTQGDGVYAGGKQNEQYIPPGGMTPRFLASIRITMKIKEKEKALISNPLTGTKEEEIIAKKIEFVGIKNKCARPELISYSWIDKVLPDQKGGWNSGKDIMDILRARGRITQSGATFRYEGLNIPEFTARGKANGEAEFLSNPEILKDAFELLEVLRKEDSSGDFLLKQAIRGVDYSESDVAGQNHAFSDEEETLVLPGERSSDVTL